MYRNQTKKSSKSYITALSAVMAAAMLAGCGSKGADGYYTLASVSEDGNVVKGDDLSDYGLDDSYVVFDDEEGYIVVMGTPEDFEYDAKDGIIKTSHGDVSVKSSGSKVTLSDSQIAMTFKKSKDKKPKKPESVAAAASSNDSGIMIENNVSNDSAASMGALTKVDLITFWSGGWYGWWEINGWTDFYRKLEGQKFLIYGTSWLTEDGQGGIFLYDDEDVLGNVNCSNNGNGLTSLGTMLSESGTFYKGTVGHADWNIDPGLYDHKNYMQIEGRYYEDDELQFDYTIHLVKWGETWDDFAPEELPDDYDWYLEAIRNGETIPAPK